MARSGVGRSFGKLSMKLTSVRTRVALLSGLLAAGLLATQHCMWLVNDADYQIGPIAPFSTCSASIQCPADSGRICVSGLCAHPCAVSSECGSNFQCAPYTNDAGVTGVCEPHCSPVSPQQPDETHVACPDGTTCVASASATSCSSVSSTSTEGQACTTVTDCQVGYDCVAAGAGNICGKYCGVGRSDCPAGFACTGFNPSIYDGPQEIGSCRK